MRPLLTTILAALLYSPSVAQPDACQNTTLVTVQPTATLQDLARTLTTNPYDTQVLQCGTISRMHYGPQTVSVPTAYLAKDAQAVLTDLQNHNTTKATPPPMLSARINLDLTSRICAITNCYTRTPQRAVDLLALANGQVGASIGTLVEQQLTVPTTLAPLPPEQIAAMQGKQYLRRVNRWQRQLSRRYSRGIKGTKARLRALRPATRPLCQRHGVPLSIAEAVIAVESNAHHTRKNKRGPYKGKITILTSNKGALGLMQVMPNTAKGLGCGNIYDMANNMRCGIKKLGKDYRLFQSINQEKKYHLTQKELWDFTLAAYLAGPKYLANDLKKNPRKAFQRLNRGKIPKYLAKVRTKQRLLHPRYVSR